MDYTQYSEGDIFVPLMRKCLNRHGNVNLLSLGENDGVTFSNSRELIELGFRATLVEPAPIPFAKLRNLYVNNDNVNCFNFAIGETTGKSKFYDSDSHLKNGDTSLLSTLIPSEIDRWKGTQKFEEIEVDVVTFQDFMNLYSPYRVYDFISIDIEGADFAALSQMNLISMKTSVVIVEWNSVDFDKFDEYFKHMNFSLVHKNGCNLIYSSNNERRDYR